LSFQVPSETYEGATLDQKEQALGATRNASQSIGELIKVGKKLFSPEGRKQIFQEILPKITVIDNEDKDKDNGAAR